MIVMIERLIELGNAYEAQGHVLFSVPSDPDYGALSRRDREQMVAGARVDVAPISAIRRLRPLEASPEGVMDGIHRGAEAALAGTSNAQRWRATSADDSTSTAAGRISIPAP